MAVKNISEEVQYN